MPEIRFAVAEPGLDIGNIETALEALTESCYYLAVERNRYHFSLKENLNKRFCDRRATIPSAQVEEHIHGEIQKVFSAGVGAERIYFPEKTIQVADRPTVTLVVLAQDQSMQDEKATGPFVETMTREMVHRRALLKVPSSSACPSRPTYYARTAQSARVGSHRGRRLETGREPASPTWREPEKSAAGP